MITVLVCLVVCATSPAISGQTPSSSLVTASSSTAQPDKEQPAVCSPITLLSAAKLTFRQRACLYGEELISPKFALTAAFAAAFGQFENSPRVPRQRFAQLPHRLAVEYSRRSARDAAELLVGALHHEDPRYHRSNARGFWNRADYALMSVLNSPGDDGRFRISYVPIAGSLGSAFVTGAMYRHSETFESGLTHAGLVYSHYFIRAMLAEFKPDLSDLARHIMHRDKN